MNVLTRKAIIMSACATAAVSIVLIATFISRPAQAFTCPADEHDGVRVQACTIGDDIQILVHNSNNYAVTVDIRTTYDTTTDRLVRASSGRIAPNFGGQLDIIEVRPYHALKQIADITLKDVVRR